MQAGLIDGKSMGANGVGDVVDLPLRFRATRARWWIVIVFSFAAITQAMTWNVCSPIYGAVNVAYGWADAEVSLFANVANVCFVLSIAPMSYIFERKGARVVMLMSGCLLSTHALLRCLPFVGRTFDALFFVSMALNGASGGFLSFGGPLLSELWFPATERTRATAIASVATYLGTALGYIVGPYIVGSYSESDRTSARAAVRPLFYVEALVCVLVFVGVVIYFPDEPNEAPSEVAFGKRRDRASRAAGLRVASDGCVSFASTDRIEASYFALFGAHGHRLTVTRFWILAVGMNLPLGVYQAWGSVLNLDLKQTGLSLSDADAGWLGFSMTVSGCMGSVVVGAAMDRFVGRMKSVITAMLILSGIGFLVFACVVCGYISMSSSSAVITIYISSVAGGFGLCCTIPLFFELSLETMHGISTENAATSVLVFLNTAVQIVFLCVPTQIDGSAAWMNWLMCGVTLGSAAWMLPFRARYHRMAMDRGYDVGVGFDRCGCM